MLRQDNQFEYEICVPIELELRIHVQGRRGNSSSIFIRTGMCNNIHRDVSLFCQQAYSADIRQSELHEKREAHCASSTDCLLRLKRYFCYNSPHQHKDCSTMVDALAGGKHLLGGRVTSR